MRNLSLAKTIFVSLIIKTDQTKKHYLRFFFKIIQVRKRSLSVRIDGKKIINPNYQTRLNGF